MITLLFHLSCEMFLCRLILVMGVDKRKNKIDRTILAITDFSQSSTNAILFAANLFQYSKLNIILLNAFGNSSERENFLLFIEDILAKKSDIGLKKQTEEITSILSKRIPLGKEQKVNISTYSLADKLKKGIAKIVESEEIDLIVSGIPAGKYPSEYLSNCPIMFMGQNNYLVLLVPENGVDKPLRSVLTLNFDSAKQQSSLHKDLEDIVNHDHIAKFNISIHEKKIDNKGTASLHTLLKKEKVDLIILIPATGDRVDRALLDYHIQELSPAVSSLLSY